MELCFDRMLNGQQTEISHFLITILGLRFFLSARCLWMVRKNQLPMLTLPIKVLLRPSFHTVMMPRKHDWLVKVIIMNKTQQLMTVMEWELRMLRSVTLSLRSRTSWSYLVNLPATSRRVTSTYLAVWQIDCLLDVLLTILWSYLKMQLNTTKF